MYQITGNTVSFRVNDEEREQLNEIALTLQTTDNQLFTNSKQVVFAMLTHCKQLQTKLSALANADKSEVLEEIITQQTEKQPSANVDTNVSDVNTNVNSENKNVDNLNTELNTEIDISDKHKIIAYLQSELGDDYNPTDEELFSELLEIITTPREPAPEVEFIKTVEVERKLTETEVLLNLKPQQINLLKTIARWRFIAKKDTHTNSLEELIPRMLFKKGVLPLVNEVFELGVPEHLLKKHL